MEGGKPAGRLDHLASLEAGGLYYTVLYMTGVCHVEFGEAEQATAYLTEYLTYPLEPHQADRWTTPDLHDRARDLLDELQAAI